MALSGKPQTLQTSPGKSRRIAWKDKDVEELLELMKEGTIMLCLENAKTHAHYARIEYAGRDVARFTRTENIILHHLAR